MLHSNREGTITAVRVGVCLCVGFHFSANLIGTLSRIPIRVDGKITPANILWAIHLIYLRTGSLTCDLKVQKQEVSRREHHRTGGSLPFLIPCLTQHMAKPFLAPTGTTLMTGTIPTALGTMLGHLKQGYLEIVAVVMRRLMAEQHSVLACGL